MKTLLIGNFGAGNVGDELILSSALEQYSDFLVMTTNAMASQTFCEKNLETIRFFPTGFRSFLEFCFSKKYREEIFSLRSQQIDRVVFAGGGLFAIKFRACVLWFLMFLWVKKILPAVPVHFEHQGVDARLNLLSKRIVQYVLRRADFISVRDESSGLAVKKLTEKFPENAGDRVTSLLNLQFLERKFQKENIVLINAIQLFSWSEFLEKFEKRFGNYSVFEFVFIAFESRDLSCVPSKFSGKIMYPQTQTQVFKLFQTSKITVGERFHSILLGEFFCGAKHTFCLRHPYSEKVQNFTKENEIETL